MLHQFGPRLTPPRVLPEFVSVHIRDVVRLVFRQIGQRVSVGSPWCLAARGGYGCASQTSVTVVLPAYTDASVARRASP